MVKEKITLTISKVMGKYRVWDFLHETYYDNIKDTVKGIRESDFEVTLITYTLSKKEVKMLKRYGINIKQGGIGL